VDADLDGVADVAAAGAESDGGEVTCGEQDFVDPYLVWLYGVVRHALIPLLTG